MRNGAPESQRQLGEQHWWVALALAAIAGSVDGIGYLLLARIFTSHMSGNTVAMTMQVASQNWHEAWRHFEPVVAFFFGVAGGLLLTDLAVRLRVARTFSLIAAAEGVLLIAFLALAHPAAQWMVVWPAMAMGIQNAMLRRVGHHRVRTTFITGMLTNTADRLVASMVAAVGRDAEAVAKFRDFLFYAGIWFCFAGGGILGAFIELKHGTPALAIPIVGLAALIGYDSIHPLIGSTEA
jgi:uncharacterized membrane protein YoaK (UPF0700 family)